jgi:hypothetical protein
MSVFFGALHRSSPGKILEIHISISVREMQGNIFSAACPEGLIAKRGALNVHQYAHQGVNE